MPNWRAASTLAEMAMDYLGVSGLSCLLGLVMWQADQKLAALACFFNVLMAAFVYVYYFRHKDDSETICLRRDGKLVITMYRGNKVRTLNLNAGWVRLERIGHRRDRLLICSGAITQEVGMFSRPEARQRFITEFAHALKTFQSGL